MNDVPQMVTAARSLLFVPAHRPDRFGKAVSSGADLVIIDLEDAVAADDKGRARDNASAWLAQGNQAIVRINAPGTPWSDDDLAMAAEHGCVIMVPKAEDRALFAAIAARTEGRCAAIPLIETPLGVHRALDVCSAPGTLRAAFGNVDLAGRLGVDPSDHAALAYARSRLVCASAAAGIAPPVDGVTTAIAEAAALDGDIAHARSLGFTGKLCIHPAQTDATTAGFAPTADELRWARAIVRAGEQVTTVAGHMVDKPVLDRARRILASVRKPRTAS
ncbi:HpcH/HpaI aldolase/citrate lyase family protein [Streptomyces sp. NPDC004609]|uniref:HpcH/HpaI aldolase/citrate lyase family protein n=1 Tax=Streptomyces sp. NPDC004609 TaxID=3364704 RepID=UPI00368843E8